MSQAERPPGGWRAAPPLRYVPYQDLNGQPSVIVDGSPAEGTVLCLSHWPGIGGPPEFQADLSAQMAFAYLPAYDRHGAAAAASNNHFDQDGLVALYALVRPEQALARQELLIDVARAGDFATYTHRDAARISMTLSSYATPDRSPMTGLSEDYHTMSAQLYSEMLDRLPELADHPERFRDVWAEEDASLTASERAVAGGGVTIEEVPELDLAVVNVPAGAPSAGGHRFAGRWDEGLHPMAVCNATERTALLVIRDGSCEFSYRYETWVRLQTRRPRPRVDLAPLADQFNAAETGPGQWVAEPVSSLTPTLRLTGAEGSSLSPASIRAAVEERLRTGVPAWHPYDHPAADA